jgi:FKBP-type peptidyl-prolyl cis-trans isomerase
MRAKGMRETAILPAMIAVLGAACHHDAPPNDASRPRTTVIVPSPSAEPGEGSSDAAPPERSARDVVTPSGLRVQELREGSGAMAEPGRRVRLHYVGTLEDGSVFDSSRARNQPFDVELGRGQLIKGFEEGVSGMRVGGLRRLVIPPELGYGDRGAGSKVPPNATLVFEVELLEVR